MAGPIIDASGCQLWMHPAWEHIRGMAEDPDASLDRRIEVARQSGVPEAALARYEESRRGENTGIARLVEPDRELVPGVEVPTLRGNWTVYETPGHAPSHVCLHQPDNALLISGDHLLGRISLFFDYGHTRDPAGEYLRSLDVIDAIENPGLCLAGHGRPFREVKGKIQAFRTEVLSAIDRVRAGLAGEPKTAFDLVGAALGVEEVHPAAGAWGLQLALAYLDHLTILGEAEVAEEGEQKRWRAA